MILNQHLRTKNSEFQRIGFVILILLLKDFVGAVNNVAVTKITNSSIRPSAAPKTITKAPISTRAPVKDLFSPRQNQPTKSPSKRPVKTELTLAPRSSSSEQPTKNGIVFLQLPRIDIGFQLEPLTLLDEGSFVSVLTTFLHDLLEQGNSRRRRVLQSGPPTTPGKEVKFQCLLNYDQQDGEGLALVSGNWTGPLTEAPTEPVIKQKMSLWGIRDLMTALNASGFPLVGLIQVKVNEENVPYNASGQSDGRNSNQDALIAAVLLVLVGLILGMLVLVIILVLRRRVAWRKKFRELKISTIDHRKVFPGTSTVANEFPSTSFPHLIIQKHSTPPSSENENEEVPTNLHMLSRNVLDGRMEEGGDTNSSSYAEEVSGVTSIFTTVNEEYGVECKTSRYFP